MFFFALCFRSSTWNLGEVHHASFLVLFPNFCILHCIRALKTRLPGFQVLCQPFRYLSFCSAFCNRSRFTFYLQDLLKEACKSFIAPLALTMKTAPFNTQQVKDGVETFFSQWCRPMGLLLQVIYDYFMFYDRSSGRWLLL